MAGDHGARPNDQRDDLPRRRPTSVIPDPVVDVAAAEAERSGRRATEPGDAPAATSDDADDAREDEAQRRHREASRRGGLKGGRARAAKLSAERRSEIARAAARARWAKRRRDPA
jgi:hypothetical protein